MNQQVYPGSTPNSLPRIDLRQILHQLCRELMSSGGFQLVEIYQWDEANDQAISLADAARAAYIENEGERFALVDFPTTARVLASGEIAVVNADMTDSETKWMGEYGQLKTIPTDRRCAREPETPHNYLHTHAVPVPAFCRSAQIAVQ